MSILYGVLIGAIAGWLAGKIMKGGGYGLVLNIILGIGGYFVGSWILIKLGIYIAGGLLGDILSGLIGALVILFIARLFKS